MKPAPFAYVRPESLEDAIGVLAERGEDARVLAGVLARRVLGPLALEFVHSWPQIRHRLDLPS